MGSKKHLKRRTVEMIARLVMLGVLLVLDGRASKAQEVLRITKASMKYDVVIHVEGCDEAEHQNQPCQCGGEVSVFRKGAPNAFQALRLPQLWINPDQLAFDARQKARSKAIYDEEYTLVFDDFNFDGKEDLAICNGRDGGYGGPSYTIYLYDSNSNRFVKSRRLSELNQGPYLGLFSPDHKNKLLTVFSKGGCCYHQTEMYKVVNNKPVLVEKVTEDAQSIHGDFVITTTRKIVGGKWVKWVKKSRRNDDDTDTTK